MPVAVASLAVWSLVAGRLGDQIVARLALQHQPADGTGDQERLTGSRQLLSGRGRSCIVHDGATVAPPGALFRLQTLLTPLRYCLAVELGLEAILATFVDLAGHELEGGV